MQRTDWQGDNWLLDGLQTLCENEALEQAEARIYFDEDRESRTLEAGKDYFCCPSCGSAQYESIRVYQAGAEYKPQKCYSCGWRPTPKAKLSANSWKQKQIDITKEMIAILIPPPKTPTSHFEASGLNDIKSIGVAHNLGGTRDWGKKGSCWGFAVSYINALHIPSMTFDLSRKEWVRTIAHETTHLSPKRGMTLEDEYLQQRTIWWKNKDPNNPYGGTDRFEGTRLEKLKDENPEIYAQMEAGWPDNKIPDNYIKADFEGGGNWNPAAGNRSNWGAGTGHGHGWYIEYQSNKGILNAKYSSWINDPTARKATKTHPETYSEQWFKRFRYANKDEVLRTTKSPQDIDLYGDTFYKDDDLLP